MSEDFKKYVLKDGIEISAYPINWGEYLKIINSPPTEIDRLESDGYCVCYNNDHFMPTSWIGKEFFEHAFQVK